MNFANTWQPNRESTCRRFALDCQRQGWGTSHRRTTVSLLGRQTAVRQGAGSSARHSEGPLFGHVRSTSQIGSGEAWHSDGSFIQMGEAFRDRLRSPFTGAQCALTTSQITNRTCDWAGRRCSWAFGLRSGSSRCCGGFTV